MRARIAGALLALAVIAAAGCGGSDDSSSSGPSADEAKSVTQQEIDALLNEDWAKACSLLTTKSRDGFVQATKYDSCEQGYAKMSQVDPSVSAFLAKTLPAYKVTDAKLVGGGSGAEVTLVGPDGQQAKTLLDPEGDNWRVSVLFSQPSSAAENQAPAPGG